MPRDRVTTHMHGVTYACLSQFERWRSIQRAGRNMLSRHVIQQILPSTVFYYPVSPSLDRTELAGVWSQGTYLVE